MTILRRQGSAWKPFSQEDKEKYNPIACEAVYSYMTHRGISCLIPFDVQMGDSNEMYKAGDIVYGGHCGAFIVEAEYKNGLDLRSSTYRVDKELAQPFSVEDIQYAWRKLDCPADFFATVDGTKTAIVFFSCSDLFGKDVGFRTLKTKETGYGYEDFIFVPIRCGHVVYQEEDGRWTVQSRPDFEFAQTRTATVLSEAYRDFEERANAWVRGREEYNDALERASRKFKQKN